MLIYFCFCLVFSEFVASTELRTDYIGDIDNFHISYSLRNNDVESQLQQLLKDAPDRVVSMKTAEQEEYKCVLPAIERVTHQQQILDYKGPSPAELIKPFIVEKTISFFSGNGYWFYDFAHGNYILQYHEDREKKERTEYFIGNYRADQSEEDAKGFNQLEPPKTKIRDVEYPYYPVRYRHGTVCAVTNKPRETTVMYVCHEQVEHGIYSITEVSSCNYELVVLTRLLCSHPAFQAPVTPEHEIYCYASPNAANTMPVNLRELQKQIHTEKVEQYSSVDSSKFSILDQHGDQEHESTQVDEPFSKKPKWMDDDMYAKYREKLRKAEQTPFWKMIRRMEKMMTDDDYDGMHDFWEGKSCFIGGHGYWRYEFCYGSKVTQFHIEGTKRTREIVLGEWNEKAHIQWFQKNRHSALILDEDNIMQVSHYYTNGDFCDELRDTRAVEVRIKCRDPPESEHPTTVFLTIDEPTTCRYVLTLQAGLFCEGLQDMDRTNGYVSNLDPEVEKLLTTIQGSTSFLKAVKEIWKELEGEEEDEDQE